MENVFTGFCEQFDELEKFVDEHILSFEKQLKQSDQKELLEPQLNKFKEIKQKIGWSKSWVKTRLKSYHWSVTDYVIPVNIKIEDCHYKYEYKVRIDEKEQFKNVLGE